MTAADIHVAVAIIRNKQREVLITRRPDHVHQGGLWEFPGGKVEPGETVEQALRREIAEELGLEIQQATAFKRVYHEYPDKNVLLDFYRIDSFTGQARGLEGQPLQWRAVEQLRLEDFPAANRGIVRCLQLPDKFMITGSYKNETEFQQRLRQSLEHGISLVQLRAKSLSAQAFQSLVQLAKPLCQQYNAKLLLNCSLDRFQENPADGLHLSSQQLHDLKQRPFDHSLLLSASCHTEADIQQALKLEADLLLLSPVKETSSHPGVEGIGWQRFAELISSVDVPVYALGGMQLSDLEDARKHGGQGIAAISSFWRELE